MESMALIDLLATATGSTWQTWTFANYGIADYPRTSFNPMMPSTLNDPEPNRIRVLGLL
jgi:hypothetical protein